MNNLARQIRRILNRIYRFPIVKFFHAPLIKAKAVSLLMDGGLAQKAVHDINAEWRARIDDVISCPDNASIPRVAEAGILKNNIITMHNGVRVYAMSYYGAGILNMLMENKGVHEPQEEKAFMEVLDYLPSHSTMLELGSYWAFYSIWLLSKLKDATCYMVEPDDTNIVAGRLNFELNLKEGHFEQAFVAESDKSSLTSLKTISVDGHCARHGINHLHVLHADIQGNEVKMLHGAKGMLSRGGVDYLFISTHSNELHYGCLDILAMHNYQILASADLENTFSRDGLIVAKRASLESGPSKLSIAHKADINRGKKGAGTFSCSSRDEEGK